MEGLEVVCPERMDGRTHAVPVQIEPQSPQKHCMVRTKRSPTTPRPRLETCVQWALCDASSPHGSLEHPDWPVIAGPNRSPCDRRVSQASQSEQRPHQHLTMHIARFAGLPEGYLHALRADEHVRRLSGDTTQPAGGVVRPIGTA